ncbi:MAG TPA: hypothetical protein VE263_02510 [Candidatus Angelobacter sp.]|nr:hypothetical protein [Candidatus Angelobacter sp.]
MKYQIWFKTSVLLLGMGGALLLAPACKAQSEVSPDHFDGTDSWATAPHSATAQTHKQTAAANASLQAKTQKNAQGSTLQLASSREVTKAAPRGGAVADRKRKATPRNPEKK